MDLPLAKSRTGVLAALSISVLLFITYYLFLFSGLNNLYNLNFHTVNYIYSSNNNSKNLYPDLNVSIKLPKAFLGFTTQWAYIDITNKGDYPVEKITITAIVPKNEELLLLQPISEDAVFYANVPIHDVGSQTQVFGKFKLLLPAGQNVSDVNLWITNSQGQIEKRLPETTGLINLSEFQALIFGLLEKILVPPWSNAILPLIAFLTVWFIEEPDENGKFDFKLYWKITKLGVFINATIIMVLFILLYLFLVLLVPFWAFLLLVVVLIGFYKIIEWKRK